MVLQSLAFISVWLATTLLVRHRGPSTAIAPHLVKFHNRSYSLLSFLLLLLILSPFPQHDTPARYVYHLSKFYEYLDILSVTASGGEVHLHFGFHHLTTPWLTFVRVLPHHGKVCEGWKWFAAANAAHHALMYAYFGGWSGVREVLLWTGEAQLGIGIAADAWAVWGRLARGEGVQELWRFAMSSGLLATYWVLHTREMRMRAREEAKRSREGQKEE
ncbi:hypothetical protein N657DRAFT_647548 [Parathielavia appendiculata]|uniref:Uncharacterized protein n=1 Tax=Parathielavia appendiculata TaxID=2587402 RepID=A0AAN6TWK0_9PEZI|nr:hypothetical protein N657DRAFT_647548 [Parathielavia appendiculata]